jgi:hypothetical protein
MNASVVEACVLSQRLADCFSSISDPRVERTRLHLLSDILSIAILSVIAGAKGWNGMALVSASGYQLFWPCPTGFQVPIRFVECSRSSIPRNLSEPLSYRFDNWWMI